MGFKKGNPGCPCCCPLGSGDLQLTLTFCETDWSIFLAPVTLVSETIVLVREEGTDTMLALAGIAGAPHADGGVVWRSAPHVWRDGYDESVGGFHGDCGPYQPPGYDQNVYLNWIFEAFCRDGIVVVLAYRFNTVPAANCVPPPLMAGHDWPDNLSQALLNAGTWGVVGTAGRTVVSGGVGSFVPASSGPNVAWVLTGTPTDDPLYRDYIRNSLTACSLFKEMVLAEPPPP